MIMKIPERKYFMSAKQTEDIKIHRDRHPGKFTRTHHNCMEATGVCRPGKTRQDRARKQ